MDEYLSMLEELAHKARMRQLGWLVAECVFLLVVWVVISQSSTEKTHWPRKKVHRIYRAMWRIIDGILARVMVVLMFTVYSLDILNAKLARRRRGVKK